MESKPTKITPELAAELLALPHHNRNLRPKVVARYASDMEAGYWMQGSTILLADTPDGQVLIDGQHRMAAVVKAGLPVEMIIVSGLTMDDQQAVDTGLHRSLSDVLTLRGEKNTSDLSTAIGFLWRRSRKLYKANGLLPTTAESLRVLQENPGLRESISYTSSVNRQVRLSRGMAACLHYEMSRISPEDADDFWQLLGSGLGLHPRHPVYLLRSRLLDNAAQPYRKLNRTIIHALIIKAWNAYRSGEDMGVLKYTAGGATPEQFPELM